MRQTTECRYGIKTLAFGAYVAMLISAKLSYENIEMKLETEMLGTRMLLVSGLRLLRETTHQENRLTLRKVRKIMCIQSRFCDHYRLGQTINRAFVAKPKRKNLGESL